MNIETKANNDALSAAQRITPVTQPYNADCSKDKLLADLKLVVSDAEAMIKEATDSSAAGFATLRAKFDNRLAETKAKIESARAAVSDKVDSARAAVTDKANQATAATHAYVKENPWQSAGILAAAGAILGFLLGRRAGGTDADTPLK
jgi:ElaB/YqjD/DUF883 family membrane-anchored ribosome-binding protein